MKCSETRVGDEVVLATSGRIDLSNADAFRDGLSAALANAKNCVIVDMAEVDYISSAGLRSLMTVFKAGKTQNKTFAIVALQPLVMEIFTITRFNVVFPLFDTVGDAVAELVPDALADFEAH